MIDSMFHVEGYCMCIHTEVEHDKNGCTKCACGKYTELEPAKKSGETLKFEGTNRS